MPTSMVNFEGVARGFDPTVAPEEFYHSDKFAAFPEGIKKEYSISLCLRPSLARRMRSPSSPDTYFVLGGNRNNSLDSRMPTLGLVPRANPRDKPIFLLWSGDRHRIGQRLD
jgi:hypothetical protein